MGRVGGRGAGRTMEDDGQAVKERVYAAYTGLAIVLVQHSHLEHIDATRATLTLLIGIVAITSAGYVADIVAHLSVRAAFPNRVEMGRMLRTAGTAIASAGVPLVLLALAAFGVFSLNAALWAASIVYVATLGLIGYLAVRRTGVVWWQQVFAFGTLVALGLTVVVLQQYAHDA
ncbi:hypothetical protein [Agromyces subbeticus]|uniref:hypothetical protein n=1 Tax=Agromyces subbeticus TaxID=293890 RepID=UPI0012EC6F77|nr:hypothetical protein [Agromyces subbeticus]